jgi:RimJ/RimL family protein N-acetyltransferase
LVTLRPVTLADVPLLHAALADVELSVLAGAIRTRAEGEQQRWTVAELEEIYARWGASHDRIVWVIVDNSSGHVVGESVLNRLDLQTGRASSASGCPKYETRAWELRRRVSR